MNRSKIQEYWLTPQNLSACHRWQELSRYKFRHFPRIDSTNLEARRDFEMGAEDYTVYVAEEQTAGRGRDGRRWLSEPGAGIYCTVLFTPPFRPAENLVFTRISALSIHSALLSILQAVNSGFPAGSLRIKPPNDLLLNGRKVCGILVESACVKDSSQFVVIGFGINVNQESFPAEVNGLATSLKMELRRSFDRARILCEVLANLGHWYEKIKRDGLLEATISWSRLTGALG